MLSVSTLKSAAQASIYYETGDYYTDGVQPNTTQWLGEGAKALGLEGVVDSKIFKKILDGQLSDGTEMCKGYNSKGEEVHRPGYDLTFSAAKSASILAFKDSRIIEAHKRAVKSTLQYIEKQAAARVKVKGVIEQHSSKNLVVAAFLHNVSRELDPHIHTHGVVANMTELNGKWRSLYGDHFYDLKKHFGLQYRLEFAQKLMKLGYELEQTSNEGFYEIKGVPKEVIKQFSKRREKIKEVLEAHGLDGQEKVTMVLHKGTAYERVVNTVASAMANFVTRDPKKPASLAKLKQQWDSEVVLAGSSVDVLDKIVANALDRGPIMPIDPAHEVMKAIPIAIQDLSNKKAVFSMRELLYSIKSLCITSFPKDHLLEQTIASQIKSQELLYVGKGMLTTKQAIELEKFNISVMQQQQNKCNSIFPIGVDLIARFLLKEPNHREALKMLLSTRDRFVAIDSQHEAAQQEVLRVFNLCTPFTRSYVVGPTFTIAQKFATGAGIKGGSGFKSFIEYTTKLVADKQDGLLDGSIHTHTWFIQRSNMLSSRDLSRLQDNAIRLDAKVVFLGDHLIKGGPDAGAPFRYLLENNIKQVKLISSKVDSITMLRERKTQEAITTMIKEGHLIECSDRDDRMQQAVKFVVDTKGVLITQNNIERQTANIEIRKLKQANGELSGATTRVQVLVPIALSRVQKGSIASFQVGDVIRFNKDLKLEKYQPSEYFSVTKVEPRADELTLASIDEQTHTLAVNNTTAGVISVFRKQMRELQKGDLLIWKDHTSWKLQPSAELAKSFGKVVTIDSQKQLTLELPTGQLCVLDLKQRNHQHLEYAYARNLTECSAKTWGTGALLLNSKSYPEVTLSDVYAGLSAIKESKKIFCNNIEQLQQDLSEKTGLGEHAYLQIETEFTPIAKHEYFSKAKGAIEGTLARHHEMLKRIVPESDLTYKTLDLPKTPEYTQAMLAVDYAIAKLSEREAVFKQQDLLDAATAYDVCISSDHVGMAVMQAIDEGWVIKKGGETLVTKEVYAMECACLKIQKQGEGVVSPIIAGPHVTLDEVKNHEHFTDSQKQAILLAITSSDRINLVQGVAGAGKTTMLKEVKRISRDAGFEVIGVANTASAKNNLSDKTAGALYNPDDERTFSDAGIPAKTLASFINQTERLLETDLVLAKRTYSPNTVFVLDEASLVSARDMFAFLNIVEQLDARAIIVGDDRQLPAIEASRPFRLMLGRGNSVAVMNINTRLKTKEALRLMQDVYAVQLDDAFDKLSDNLVEIPDRGERLGAMATYYLGAKKEDRAEIMPMLPLNADRVAFNELVRKGLKKEGTLTGEEISTTILITKDLTHPERTYALSFAEGDLVRFNHNIPRLGINRGDYLLVEGIEDHKVVLRDQNGDKLHWAPARFAAYFKGAVEVYTAEERILMAGDEIRWRRNDEKRGIVNSDLAKVVAVEEGLAAVRLASGEVIKLDLTNMENQHWDHAYGATVHVVQGLDRRNPIGHGVGEFPIEQEISKIKKDDLIIIPANKETNTSAKIGKVIEQLKAGSSSITVVDRSNKQHILQQDKFQVYPCQTDPDKAPKISSLESFLVMATRGDELVMFVDCIESYKAALIANKDLKKTALEMMLPGLSLDIKEKVQIMTGTVYGLAEMEQINKPATKRHKEKSTKTIVSEKEQTSYKKNARRGVKFNKENSKQANFDVEEIKQGLERDVLGYVTQWKGEPNKRTSRDARWGAKGSFSVVLSGPKIGSWADFEAGVAGGDLISLYMYVSNLSKSDFHKALKELAHYAGIGPMKDGHQKINTSEDKQKKAENLGKEARARAEYINKATKLYNNSIPLKGTLGEKYLRNFRGLKGELPTNFRFQARCWHSELDTSRAAIIVPGHDKDGKLQSVNRIYLNKDGSKLKEQYTDSDGKVQNATDKKTYGPTSGATVEINVEHKHTGTTFVTEGAENALSIKQVIKDDQIVSSFGVWQLKHLTMVPSTKTIVLCADHDGLSGNTKGPMLEAIKIWLEQGYQVKMALPFGKNPVDKFDFNDLLKQQGENAVSKCLNNAVPITNVLDLGEKSSPLYKDFLRLKENNEQAKIKEAAEITNKQQLIQRQDAGIER